MLLFVCSEDGMLSASRNRRRMIDSRTFKFLLSQNMNKVENPTIIWGRIYISYEEKKGKTLPYLKIVCK